MNGKVVISVLVLDTTVVSLRVLSLLEVHRFGPSITPFKGTTEHHIFTPRCGVLTGLQKTKKILL